MILQALYEYYQRRGNLAADGFEWKEIAYLIVIDREGTFLRLESQEESKNMCKKFLVIKSNGRTSSPKANVFWDNTEYVLGINEDSLSDFEEVTNEKEQAKREKNIQNGKIKRQLFVEIIDKLSELYPANIEFTAVSLFYKQEQINLVQQDVLWEKLKKKLSVNLSFKVEGSISCVAEHDDLINYNENSVLVEDDCITQKMICLITGERAKPTFTTTATMIPGSQATAKLVSFQIKSGYDSYGKSQGLNAPISKKAEAAFTTALASLLSKGSRNKFMLGNRTFVFWASSQNDDIQQFENAFATFWGVEVSDDPDKNIQSVIEVFKSPHTGVLKTAGEESFYILGLAPNAARISVSYWQISTLADFASKIALHLEDMEIIDTRKDKKDFFPLKYLLRCVTLQGKDSNIQPNLPEAFLYSILQGTAYPASLQQSCIRRIRAEQSIFTARAAILKACVNRSIRINNYKKENYLTMALDKENKNLGYLCGRLFAVLEYTQEKGMQMTNIRERYLNAGSATPAVVFPRLLALSNHHSAKIDKVGLKVNLEKLKGEIFEKFGAGGFPTRLNLNDQSCFMVGYYHQRQDFYTKGDNTNNE